MKNLLLLSFAVVFMFSCSSDNSGPTAPTQPAPSASFTASSTTVNEGGTINFSNTSQNGSSYTWAFEGGTPNTSSQENPTITYSNAGTYNVSLVVTNSAGTDTESRTDYIIVNAVQTPPSASFSASSTKVERTSTINFTDESTNNPTSWMWTFQGGSPSSSTDQNPSVTYDSSGEFNVTLKVTNADGSDTETKVNFIEVNPLSATYSVTFKGNWSAANHPTDFPSNDHFSRAVGMVHKTGASIYETGALATAGIEQMAETGSNTTLQNEVNAIINAGNALSYINGPNLGAGDSQATFTITVTEDFPFVTLVSMIAPSPDWYVAVKDVELFTGGTFVDNISLPAGSYDSGTDSGNTFASANDNTNPAENIALITTAPLGNGTTVTPAVAEFIFAKN